MITFRVHITIFLSIYLILPGAVQLHAQTWTDLAAKVSCGSFVPITDVEVLRQRELAANCFAELLARIPKGNVYPSSWEEFISTSRLAPEFDKPAELQRIIDLLGKDVTGMEYAPLQQYRVQLQRYLTTQAAANNPVLPNEFDKHHRAFVAALSEFANDGSAAKYARIAGEARWAMDNGQLSNQLIDLKTLSHRNNLDVRVYRKLVSAYIQDTFVRPQVVKDCILGTAIRGQAMAYGRSDVELVPSNSYIKLNIVVRADVSSDTVGYNGPVRIYSDGSTQILTRKPVFFDGHALRGLPAYSRANTSSVTKGIDTKFQGVLDRLVTKIAAGQIEKKKDEGNAVAARHAERDTNKSVDADADRMLVESNATLYEEYIRPATIRGFLPTRYDLSTNEQSLRFATLFSGKAHIGSAQPPAIELTSGDVRASIHQTMVNNLLDIYLAGKSFTVDDLKLFAASLEKSAKSEKRDAIEDKDETSGQSKRTRLTLDSRYPIELVFDDQQVFLNIRAKSVQIDRTTYSAMNIGLRFHLRQENGQWLLEHDGQPLIVPPRMELDPQAKLSGPEVAVRRILRNLIVRDLPKSTPISSLPLQKDDAVIGMLKPTLIHSKQGWLSFSAEM